MALCLFPQNMYGQSRNTSQLAACHVTNQILIWIVTCLLPMLFKNLPTYAVLDHVYAVLEHTYAV